MSDYQVIATHRFKKHFKKVSKNPRWQTIFNEGATSFQSPWEFVIQCFITGEKIPAYYYVHEIVISKEILQGLRRQYPQGHLTTRVLELHLDGHNGDHLLMYVRVESEKIVCLLDIGTHSDLLR